MRNPALHFTRGTRRLLLLAVAFLGSWSYVHAQDSSSAPLDPREVAEDYFDAFEAFIEDADATRFEYTPRTDPNLTGEAAELQAFMVKILQFAAAETNAYFAELESVQFMNLLDPERLKGDPDYTESRTILVESRRVIDKYAQRSDLLVGQFASAIDQLSLSASDKAGIRAGMMQGVEAGLKRRERIWELEKESLKSFDAIIDLLATTEWYWEGEFITFEDDADAVLFDGHLDRVIELGDQQMQIQREPLNE